MAIQTEVFLGMELVFRKEGYGQVFDEWGNKLDGLKNYK
jgi:hypothetical protein